MSHVLRRLVWAVFIVWAVTTVAFFLNNVLPSDPARMAAGPQARPGDVTRLRKQLGLDRPVATQYLIFMRRLVHFTRIAAGVPARPGVRDPGEQQGAEPTGEAAHRTCASLGVLHVDLGKSYQQRRPVVAILAERLPRTAFLALVAVLVQVFLGVATGVLAAVKRRSIWDHGVVGLTLLGISAPTFIIGLFLQFALAHKLRLLPLDGFGLTNAEHAVSVILPALTLGIFGAAYYTRLVRDEMIVLMKQDYVRTARAKGVGEIAVVLRHALRNALVPLVTVIALDLGALVGGAIVTETLFRWPGIGALSVSALLDRDGPVILGTVLLTSTAIVVSNLLADFAYVALDPRIRKT
jgi:peptide/nickel transport system permease protein